MSAHPQKCGVGLRRWENQRRLSSWRWFRKMSTEARHFFGLLGILVWHELTDVDVYRNATEIAHCSITNEALVPCVTGQTSKTLLLWRPITLTSVQMLRGCDIVITSTSALTVTNLSTWRWTRPLSDHRRRRLATDAALPRTPQVSAPFVYVFIYEFVVTWTVASIKVQCSLMRTQSAKSIH